MSDWSEVSETGRQCCSCRIHTDNLVEATEDTHLFQSRSIGSDVLINNFDRIWLSCLGMVIFVGAAAGTYLFYLEYQNDIPIDLDMISRDLWGANTTTENITGLVLPLHFVLILPTNTSQCENQTECISRIYGIQKHDMEVLNEPDILFNFIVAGDGRIYEGRGWESKMLEDAVVLGVTGNEPSKGQTATILSFLHNAVRAQKLVPCYKVLGPSKRTHFIDLVSVIEAHNKEKELCVKQD